MNRGNERVAGSAGSVRRMLVRRMLTVWAFCGVWWWGASGLAQLNAPIPTTVQLPTFGVAIDAAGELKLTSVDPTGQLRAERFAAARRALPGPLAARSALRKVSLVRLERELARDLAASGEPSDAVLHLAGIQRITHVFCAPDSRDVIVAGPAEGWYLDPAGRAVGMSTGAPVLRLDDLAVALRAFPPEGRPTPFLGCTIDPPAEGLERLREFQRTIPKSVPVSARGEVADYVARGIRESLGKAQVRVFGVAPTTHFAQVLVEADYRMKCIGVGVESPPVKMVTFFEALESPKQATLQRWWFTPRYEGLVATPDRLAARFDGLGVKLQTEDKVLGADGKLLDTAAASGPSVAYAKSFTDKYERIAAASPVYAELRNLIDVSIVAAFLRKHDFYRWAEWRAELLGDERRFKTERLPIPKHVSCVSLAAWKGSRLIAPAGGGVSIHPDLALDEALWEEDKGGELAARRTTLRVPVEPDAWWWD